MVDYVVCMGYLVVVGDSVCGMVNGQIILGVEVIFSQVNSVVLGYCLVVNCGVQVSYSVYGLIIVQVLVGEVLVGFVGGEWQIINVVVGSVVNDVVNVVQLQGVILQIDVVSVFVVIYDDDGVGNVNYCWIMLGEGIGIIMFGNFVNGVVVVGSIEVVMGDQLFGINMVIVDYFGGFIVYDLVIGVWMVLSFQISIIFSIGVVVQGVYDNVIDVFLVVDGLLVNFNMQIIDICNGVGSCYLKVNFIGIDVSVVGLDSIVVGMGVMVMVVNVIVVGVGVVVDCSGMVLVGVVGSECQVVNVVVGMQVIDVVNLGQLQVFEQGVLCYDENLDGSFNFVSVMFGNGIGLIMLCNIGVGVVGVFSIEVINGVQLFVVNQVVVIYLGGGVVVDVSGVFIVLSYMINQVVINGQVILGMYDNVGSVFDVVSQLLVNVVDQIDIIDKLVVKYDVDVLGNVINQIILIGDGIGVVVGLGNFVDGSVLVGSCVVVIGNQLFQINNVLVGYFGGIMSFDGNMGIWIVLIFCIFMIFIDGSVVGNDYSNVIMVFVVVDVLLIMFNMCIDQIQLGVGSLYVQVNLFKWGVVVSGVNSVVIGLLVSVGGVGSVVVGDGVSVLVDNSIVLGSGLVVSVGVQSGYIGVYGVVGVSSLVGEVVVGSSGVECKVIYVVDGFECYDVVNVGQLQNGVNYVIDQFKVYIDMQIININNGMLGMFQVNNI